MDGDPLRDRLRGTLLTPDNEGYDDARAVWNAMVDRRPAAIVRCAGVADVIAAVNAARKRGLSLSVKAGGHHVSGSALCEGGLVADLGEMKGIRVDPHTKTVRVQAGATWGELDHETQAFGLAVPGGQDPNIGVAGLTLGGGVGWLSPKYGLACDNLLSADVVTAEGTLVHASDDENSDLFWALRGGGGNLGVVTSFEFQLHDIGPEVFGGTLVYPHEKLPAVLECYREFMADAPREVRLLFGSMALPAASVYPTEMHGSRVAMLIAFYAGPAEEGEQVLEPIRDCEEPLTDTLRPRTYTGFQQAGGSEGPLRTDLRSQYLATVPETAARTILEHAAAAPSAGATVFLSPWLGAETDPASDATAYPHREPAHHLLIEARWEDPADDDDHTTWVSEFHEAMEPYTTGDVELNFLTSGENERRRRAALGENNERLRELKTQWDPDNLFSVDPVSSLE